MRKLTAVLERIARTDSTVLLEGETGTGKTLIAHTLHRASERADRPFIVVDGSAIAPSLIESELFGHERGAFTGAHATRAGAFEGASGGTLFLDEIGELPLDLQPKLLRALEERVVKRIGSSEPIRLDVRLIAATNRDLDVEVARGSFRADLFYRLNVVRVRVPSLRERREDIPLLASSFFRQLGGRDVPAPELLARLMRRPWPGNVRELRSAVERIVLLGSDELGEADAVAGGESASQIFDPNESFRDAKERVVGEFERVSVRALLEHYGGNLSRAARAVRMDRNHLRDLLRRHQVGVARRS
jgi:DNA-binding NtrC family response regulator